MTQIHMSKNFVCLKFNIVIKCSKYSAMGSMLDLPELSATSGKTTTIKIGFYFFTYECCRRRLSLIKMINGVEEALILLFAAFRYEYLF